VIISAIAVLVLAGAGLTVYLLTRSADKPAASQGDSRSGGPGATGPTTAGQSASTPASAPPPPTGPAAAEVGSARQVAEQAVQALNGHNTDALKKISCDPAAIGPADNAPPEARVELAANPELTGDTATVELKLIIGDQSTTTPLPLRKQNGVWCVD
jgi:hypothetical protein